jgi:hypothetical protein
MFVLYIMSNSPLPKRIIEFIKKERKFCDKGDHNSSFAISELFKDVPLINKIKEVFKYENDLNQTLEKMEGSGTKIRCDESHHWRGGRKKSRKKKKRKKRRSKTKRIKSKRRKSKRRRKKHVSRKRR